MKIIGAGRDDNTLVPLNNNVYIFGGHKEAAIGTCEWYRSA